MNYERIILELMSRIQNLEERVTALEGGKEQINTDETDNKVTTADIRNYIQEKIRDAAGNDAESITLRARDIHREMKLKSRFPMVCNAMRQCMKKGDEVVYEPASGYSSTLEITYYCNRTVDETNTK